MNSPHPDIDSQIYIRHIIVQSNHLYLSFSFCRPSYNVVLCKLGTKPNHLIIAAFRGGDRSLRSPAPLHSAYICKNGGGSNTPLSSIRVFALNFNSQLNANKLIPLRLPPPYESPSPFTFPCHPNLFLL